ncbi:PLP-dependent aminotransferase family protein [Rhodobacteraceae bacterium D3-12]|nr:PLP-dependent aminotransferase family protein [Rhodobacteraceae bacterium D3-12]
MTDTIWPPDFENTTGAKYIVLIQSLRAAVRSGELPNGHRLPPVREMAWQLGITPGTVARAYKLAAEEGLVETAVGRGTFVSGQRAPMRADVPLINIGTPDMVNFRSAQVLDVGQAAEIGAAMSAVATRPGFDCVTYPTELTDRAAREAIVQWIGPERAGRITAQDVVLTLGAQNATILALMAVLRGPTPIVLTDGLSYPGARHAARMLRARVIGVEMDEEGLRPDVFEALLREHGAQVLLTSAEAHNPTCLRTSLGRRQELAAIARRHRVQIIEDDSHCIDWEGRAAYREMLPELSWYISALTKSVSSGMRVGYMVAPVGQAVQARQVAESAFYGLPQPMIDVTTELLTSGVAAKIRDRVRHKIRERVQKAVNVLGGWDISYRDDLPFLWLRLPDGWRGSSFVQACERAGVQIKAADEFALADEAAPNAVRIGLSADVDEARYVAALRRMAEMLAVPPRHADV